MGQHYQRVAVAVIAIELEGAILQTSGGGTGGTESAENNVIVNSTAIGGSRVSI